MITKKHARRFKERVDKGERPKIPFHIVFLLQYTSQEIKRNIARAKAFDYGTGRNAYVERFVEMGLFDEDFNLTPLGQEYKDAQSKENNNDI